MKRVRYPAEFKAEAVKQVTERLGMSDKSLYLWVRLAKAQPGAGSGENASLRRRYPGSRPNLKEPMRSVTS